MWINDVGDIYIVCIVLFTYWEAGTVECRVGDIGDRALNDLWLAFSLWLIQRFVGIVVIMLDVRNDRYQR